jgi:hypothetical protein
MTTISRGASNTDRSMSDDDQPGSEDRLRSQVATLRGPLPRTLKPRVSQFWRGPWGGGHAVTGGLWILQRDEDSIDRSGLLTM